MSALTFRRSIWLLAVATIVGQPAGAQQPPAQPNAGAKITKVTPPAASAGIDVTIEGAGFGERTGQVKFGTTKADNADEWKENSIKVKVPKGLKAGPTPITVISDQGREIAASPELFTVTTHEPAGTPKLLGLYVLLLVGFVLLLHLVDNLMSYHTFNKLVAKWEGTLTRESTKALQDLAPAGIPGTSRSILAYGLLLVLAISVFHLLAIGGSEKAPEYADKILTVLSGSLSAIVGFYFGSKATREGAEAGAAQRAETPMKPIGRITKVVPPEGSSGTNVTIEGVGFGDRGQVLFHGTLGTQVSGGWKDNSINLKVPDGLEKGPTAITVNPSHNEEIVGSPELFRVI